MSQSRKVNIPNNFERENCMETIQVDGCIIIQCQNSGRVRGPNGEDLVK